MNESRVTSSPGFIQDHAQFVRGLAKQLIADESAARDLEQQTWLETMKSSRAEVLHPRAWLRAVMSNLARRQIRDRQRREQVEEAAGRELPAASANEVLRTREWCFRAVSDAVAALPDRQREVVLLRFYEGLKPREIARRLKVPTTTVQSRLQRAIAAMRTRLDRHRDREDRDQDKNGDEVGGKDWRGAFALSFGLATPRVPVAVKVAAGFAVSAACLGVVVMLAGNDEAEPRRLAGSKLEAKVAEREALKIERALGGVDQPAKTSGARFPESLPVDVERRFVRGRALLKSIDDASSLQVLAFSSLGSFELRPERDGSFEGSVPVVGLDSVALWIRSNDGERAGFGLIERPQPGVTRSDRIRISLATSANLELKLETPTRQRFAGEVAVFSLGHPFMTRKSVRRRRLFLGCHQANADSRLQLPGLVAGNYWVIARDPECGTYAEATLSLDEGEQRQVSLALSPGRTVRLEPPPKRFAETAVEGGRELALDLIVASRQDSRPLRWPWPPGRLSSTPDTVPLKLRAMPPNRELLVVERDDLSRSVLSRVAPDAHRALVGSPDRDSDWVFVPVEGPMPKAPYEVIFGGGRRDFTARSMPGGLEIGPSRPRDQGEVLVFSGDGRMARFDLGLALAATAAPVAFLPANYFEVQVRDAEGGPRSGASVVAICERDCRIERQGISDASGRVRLGPFESAEVDLYLGDPSSWMGWHRELGPICNSEGQHHIDLGEPRRVELRVSVDGVSGFPQGHRLVVHGALVTELREDSSSGVLSFLAWTKPDEESCQVGLLSEGFGDGGQKIELQPRVINRAELHLARLQRVELEIVPPVDGIYEPAIERWVPKRKTWIRVGQGGAVRVANHRYRWPFSAKGRYRVFDAASGITTEPFMIEVAPSDLRVQLDLAGCRELKVQTELPEDHQLDGLKIRLDSKAYCGRWAKLDLFEAGFRLRWDARRSLVLKCRHPLLRLSNQANAVEVPAGSSESRLSFELQPMMSLAFTELSDREADFIGGVVVLRRPGPRGATVRLRIVRSPLRGAAIRQAPPGLHEVWIVPRVGIVRSVGRREFSGMEALRVPARPESGFLSIEPPIEIPKGEIRITVTALELPFFARRYELPAGKLQRIGDLIAGRYRVDISPMRVQLGNALETFQISVETGKTARINR